MATRKWFWVIAGVAGAALQIGVAVAEPTLWKVQDKDSTLYLFGTIHVLKPDAHWRDAQLDAAFQSAAEIWFEVDLNKAADPASLAPYQALLIDPARPLSVRLSKEEYARFSKAAAELGLPVQQLDILRPWVAAQQLTLTSLTKAGLNAQSGVDQTLTREVGSRPLKPLETLEQQLRFFADLPEDVEKALLLDTLDEIAKGPGQFDRLQNAWLAGDLRTLQKEFVDELQAKFPALYEVLLKRRNQLWAAALDAELKGAGSDFVAVGAAHLVGPDGLPELLRQRGYRVKTVARP